jgi:putative nucleotidyltransferase with HDIG domain
VSAFGGVRHLARRFFGSLRTRFPDADGQRLVATTLTTPGTADIFWGQQRQDVVHGIAVARLVLDDHPDRADLARAALLHDVGKAASRLGVIGRSLATILAATRLPVGARMHAYLDHAQIGARMLETAGIEDVAVAFARHHRDAEAPSGVDPSDWAILRRADHGA